MTDHHDFSHDDHQSPLPDDHQAWDDPGHDFGDAHLDDGDDFGGAHDPDLDGAHDAGLDGAHEPSSFDPHDGPAEHSPLDDPSADPALTADPHDAPDLSELPGEEVFPPPVDVGPLPEPVDGFPWIDTGSLGLADIQAAIHDQDHTDPVRPEELAEYAGTDLPPGADPWATLADSDDPATAALAKWWQQN